MPTTRKQINFLDSILIFVFVEIENLIFLPRLPSCFSSLQFFGALFLFRALRFGKLFLFVV